MKNKIYIAGCGGHARSVADVLLFNNPHQECIFVDKNSRPNEKVMGFSVETTSNQKIDFIAIGENSKRQELYQPTMINIICKDAYVSPSSIIGRGNFIAHQCHLGPETKIGNGCILNTASIIEHQVVIGDFTHISVNATICGKSQIGNNVFVGAGSVVKDKIHICDNVIIGAGSVVIKDIIHSGTYVGNPVRKVK